MSAAGPAIAAEMAHLQRMAPVLPPLCNLCSAAAQNAKYIFTTKAQRKKKKII
jgi:hypothetical protein